MGVRVGSRTPRPGRTRRLAWAVALPVSAVLAVVGGAVPAAASASARFGVLAWGSGGEGQFGDGSTPFRRPTPGPVLGLSTNVVQVSTEHGAGHGLAVLTDGSVWAWGRDRDGELGDGQTPWTRPTAARVPGVAGIIQVAAGAGYSLALRWDGTVWSWGANDEGQLGDRSFEPSLTPVQVSGLTGVRQIIAGYMTALALLWDGTVRVWGLNDVGQIGNGTVGNGYSVPVQVPGLTGVTQLASDGNSTLALLSDGTVRGWGANGFGQLGDGSTTERHTPVVIPGLANVRQLSVDSHGAAVSADGTVLTWGANGWGQLGDGTTSERHSPGPVPNLSSVVQVAVSPFFTMALLADGTVRAWGGNSEGELGDGTFTDRHTPITVPGVSHANRVVAGYTHAMVVVSLGDYSVSVSPPTSGVARGGSVTSQVSLTAIDGYAGSPALSDSGLPAGVTASFAPATVSASTPATMTLTTSPSSPTGTFQVTVTATDAALGVSRSTTYQLVITAAATVAVPNLQYSDPYSAAYFVQNAGLVVGTVSTTDVGCNFAGMVVEQSPAAGTVVPLGSAVSFTYVDPNVCF